jgi:hypothetical protein
MNERIRELAEQAGIDDVLVPKDVFGKFAELIINECIRVLNKDIHLAIGYDGEQTYYDVTLLEHFDVDYLELSDE